MKHNFLLGVLLVTLVGCSKTSGSKEPAPDPVFNLPPTEKLSAEQEAEALEFYRDYMEALAATTAISDAQVLRQEAKNNSAEIRALLGERCKMTRIESRQGQTYTSQQTARNAQGQICPVQYLASQVLAISGSQQQVNAQGTVRTSLNMIGAELAALTPVDAYEWTGAITMNFVKASESSSQLAIVVEQNGSLIISGTKLQTLQRVRMNTVTTVNNDNSQAISGTTKMALGAKMGSGWVILLINLNRTIDGKTTIECTLNGNSLAGDNFCRQSGSQLLTAAPQFSASLVNINK